jgi:hypothetical protein
VAQPDGPVDGVIFEVGSGLKFLSASLPRLEGEGWLVLVGGRVVGRGEGNTFVMRRAKGV